MSIYDSSLSGSHDNERTRKAKTYLQNIIKRQLTAKGFKCDVKTEVPATFTEPKPVAYHLDVGVLFRNPADFSFYHFFGCEIDDSSHATFKREKRDRIRDESFFNTKGIVTCRIPIDKLYDEHKDEERFFDKYIYQQIALAYIINSCEAITDVKSEMNQDFAILLKENAYTKCSKCDHKAQQHDLTGCSFRHTNKSKLKCNCNNPFFRSDE